MVSGPVRVSIATSLAEPGVRWIVISSMGSILTLAHYSGVTCSVAHRHLVSSISPAKGEDPSVLSKLNGLVSTYYPPIAPAPTPSAGDDASARCSVPLRVR